MLSRLRALTSRATLLVAFILLFTTLWPLVPAWSESCVQVDWDTHACTGALVNNSSVDIWAHTQSTQPAPSSGGEPAVVENASLPMSPASDHEPTTFYDMCMRDVYFAAAVVECMGLVVHRNPLPLPPLIEPSTTVTMDDLAHFIPQGVSLIVEPGAWTVSGVHTNFIAPSSVNTVAGSLFGHGVEVKFTPVMYDWSFGDGESLSTRDSGARWSELGVTEFTRTATSHRYVQVGQVNPSVTLWYSVEYRWVSSGVWKSVSGRISRTARTSLSIFTADTVLVTGACTVWNPAPGC